MRTADRDVYKDYLSDFINMVEDCDIDCQAKGSQLTPIAFLMVISHGVVLLNALFMLLGSVMTFFRVVTIYFAVCACAG